MKMSHRFMYTYAFDIYNYIHVTYVPYGVATISRVLRILGIFCKRAL